MVVIIEGCGHNLASHQMVLQRLGIDAVLTSDKHLIKKASRVILPGVGHAKQAMANLTAVGLCELIVQLTQPVLAICVGMHLLYDYSDEGDTMCLGIIPGEVKRLAERSSLSLPHMGWNTVYSKGSGLGEYAYFAHSYGAPIGEHTVATTEYTEKFTSIVHYNNFTGMQFHPERSGKFGERMIKQFIEGDGR